MAIDVVPRSQADAQEVREGVEIERKFIVERLPEGLAAVPAVRIQQGYVAIAPSGAEIRLRRKGAAHTLTVKGPGAIHRCEQEVALAPPTFDALWPLTDGRRLEKTRAEIPYGKHVIDLDFYGGDLDDLVIAEVEFDTEAEARSFVPPSWFGREVTDDSRYRNQSLARAGSPARTAP